MQLVIDYGNTCVKLAVFASSGDILYQCKWDEPTQHDYQALLQTYRIDAAIVCSVVEVSAPLLQFLKQQIAYVLVLDHQTPLPIINAYKTPNTLGYDRLAAAVGANAMHPNTPLLVIDAGTAITYDFVSPNNEFVGGNIAPGAAMRFNALHHFTQKLPQLSLSADVPQQTLGFNTQTAIQLGVVNGIVYEIEGYIKELREKYPQLLIFLTGGDAFFFERRIKSSIFVFPNLLLFGLHRILMYNQCL